MPDLVCRSLTGTQYSSATYEQNVLIKPAGGIVKAVFGSVLGNGFIVLVDKASALAGGEVPFASVPVLTNQWFLFDFPKEGWEFQLGLNVAFSSAIPYTAGGANGWFNVRYH